MRCVMPDTSVEFYQNTQLITQVEYAMEQLGLYRAELARILGLHCDDVSDAVQLELLLDTSQVIHHQAERFIRMFRLAELFCSKENHPITNWFRQPMDELGTSPFYAMVDQGRLEDLVALLNSKI